MLKKTIEYQDLDGNTITEDFYFNLTEAEIAELELSKDGGLKDHFERIIAERDGAKIIQSFKEILSIAYGRRHEDGKQFVKSPEQWRAFEQTDAYTKLFMELLTSGTASAEFIKAVLPDSLSTKIPEELKDGNKSKEELLAMYKQKLAEIESSE